MSSISQDAQEAQAKVDEYTQFLDRVLRPELQEAKRQVEEIEHEIKEYQALKQALGEVPSLPPPNAVDLGFQTIYCPAQYAKDPKDQVFVDLGLGFHVEMNAKEAREFIDKRVIFLQENRLNQRQKRLTTVQDHIQSSLNVLEQLEMVQKQLQK
ncbi:Prefoldin subunit [Seminavis robusta]|uniref:Prefoldin subunit n=1 Tax=Seminavis robusta TaxID=568900 RepID=A0A9N8DNG7_9STRA|nr:Prefoldin subunit [Seminavis robusta]|eukprot:Sro227_g092210.1 Prefoldin subunit (154) ;mRNA; f:21405-21866